MIIVIALFLIISNSSQNNSNWQTFYSSSDQFKTIFPTYPDQEVKQVKIPNSTNTLNVKR